MLAFPNPLFARGDAPAPPVSIDPATLFTAGYTGLLLNPAEVSAQFQNSDGTGAAVANDPIGRGGDLSGLANHAVQATAGLKPLLKQSGGVWWYETDGVDDALRAPAGMGSMPFDLIFAFRALAEPGNAHVIGGPTVGMSGTTLYMYSGFSGAPGKIIATAIDYVVTCRFDGATSRMRINRDAYFIGNPGTDVGGALAIGNHHGGSGAPTRIRLHGLFARTGGAVLSDGEVTGVENWMAARQGRTL